jgi:hypothetical protein
MIHHQLHGFGDVGHSLLDEHLTIQVNKESELRVLVAELYD